MAVKMLVYFAATSFFAWILLLAGLSQRRESRRRNEQEHTRTTGVIVRYASGKPRAGRGGMEVTWRPVIEFTADGQKIEAEYENAVDQDRYPVGREVDIRYDVSDPLRFHLEDDPVFTNGGEGAIRIGVIWIIASAALTILLATLAGGFSIDLRRIWYRFVWFLRHHRILR